jgi:hypothetical protein
LTHKGHLPPIKELRKTKTEEKLFEEIQQNMNQRQEDASNYKGDNRLNGGASRWITKTQTMIQDFMDNLKRDMKTLSNNSASHTTSLEELLYRRVISIEGKFKVIWI